MNLQDFINTLNSHADSIEFNDTMSLIDELYLFTPNAFRNGQIHNAVDQNNGSCKLFAFAKLHGLNEQQTLSCFGKYYREDVLKNPDGDDHQNIRNFLQTGWAGIEFETIPLTPINHEEQKP